MAFDAGMLSFVINEINSKLAGGKVDKVYQPSHDEFVFIIRKAGETSRLLMNAGSRCPHVGITFVKTENPAKAPMLCMMFRKHLQGSVFEGGRQLGFERAAEFSFDCFDEMGFKVKKRIIVELMGKYSNIIFTDDSGKIISLLRQVDFAQSLKRQLLPGMIYEVPPSQGRADPTSIDREGFMRMAAACEGQRSCEKFIMSSFSGISPLVAREIAMQSGGSADASMENCADRLYTVFCSVMKRIASNDGAPTLVCDARGIPVEYGFMPLTQYNEPYRSERLASFGELLDRYFNEKSRDERISQRAGDVNRLVNSAYARVGRRLEAQRDELEACKEGAEFKRLGDLITANIYRLKRGMDSALLTDYNSGNDVSVALDRRLTPAQNAQRYYKKYAKSKSAREHLTSLISDGEKELIYLASVQDALTRVQSEKELSEIRSELYHSGYASKMKNFSEKKQSVPSYLVFRTTGGYRVLCGKNNNANDWLTFRHAAPSDWWFHAKNTPGSHVIMECAYGDEPPAEDFTQACTIAAVYSKAAEGASADVDYTRVRQVKKPAGAKPGFVIYHNNWSATVVPDRQLCRSLESK